METLLQKMREAYNQAKQQQPTQPPTLKDISINTETKEINFIWNTEK